MFSPLSRVTGLPLPCPLLASPADELPDIAAEAEVSVATVDRVLNGRARVREETARRVYEAADRIGYHAAGVIRQRMRLIDLQHPFFRPLWRRIVVVVLCLGWAAFEFVTGAPFWGTLFGGIGLYCAWAFFMAFEPREDTDSES